MAKKSAARPPATLPLLEELEARILFSADAAIVGDAPGETTATVVEQRVVDTQLDADQPADIQLIDFAEVDTDQSSGAGEEYIILGEDEATASQAGKQLIVIDTGIDDYQTLLDELTAGREQDFDLLFISAEENGFDRLTQSLQNYSSQGQTLDAVHILSHGQDGQVRLGNSLLNQNTLGSLSPQLQQWETTLTPNADLLIYGCNLAASDDGIAIVESLAQLTGADVAASDDATGTAILNADWELEVQRGEIESETLFISAENSQWNSVLAIVPTSETLVNTTTAATQTTTTEIRGSRDAVAMDSNGNQVVVWADSAADGSGYGVFAQRFNASGSKVGSEFQINQTSTNDQYWASVAMADNGNFTVTWTSVNQDGPSPSIYARQFNADGTPAGNEFRVNDSINTQTNPSISMAGDGRFIIVWQGSGATDTDGIYGKLYDAAGNGGSEFIINTTTSGAQTDPAVSMNDNGESAVIWNDGSSLKLDWISSTGVVEGTEKQVNLLTTTVKGDVALDNNGNTVVAFGYNGFSDDGVYYRQFDSSRADINGTTSVPPAVSTGPGLDATAPSITMDPATGDFIVTWEETGDGSLRAVYAKAFASDQSVLWNTIQLNQTTNNDQINASVAMLDTSNFVTVWSGEGAGDTDGVFIRQYSTNTLIVDTASDTSDGDTSSIAALLANKGSDGSISLREAITAANNTTNGSTPDNIVFNIAGSQTITVASALPTITEAVIIDGTTDPDFAGTPVIELDGSAAATGTNGLVVTSGGSTIRGLVINQFNGSGIRLETGGGNVIEGNYIGTDVSGTLDLGNRGVQDSGIDIIGSSNNTIGGTSPGQGNLISGNDWYGIAVTGPNASNNLIVGNIIGLDASGTSALGNALAGISLYDASSNIIGGTDAASRNVISGNSDGIKINSGVNPASGNQIIGNYIGTDITGNAAVGNSYRGVSIVAGAASNIIGGSASGSRNIISGNGDWGIEIANAGSDANIVYGNYIGVGADGTTALGNGASNINGNDGIAIRDTAQNNIIGGTGAGEGNLIANNTGAGVMLQSTAVNNSIRGNSIYANTGLAIDLNDDGSANANDSGDGDTGANNLQNTPVISAASLPTASDISIQGTLNSTPNSSFTLDFYENTAAGSASYSEARRYLGSTSTLNSDASGNLSFDTTLNGVNVATGSYITVTATDSNGNTSEVSSAFILSSNTSPTDITLATSSVDENTDTTGGYSLGQLTATDPDTGDTFSWSIVGGADQALFSIGGSNNDELILDDGLLNAEIQSSYNVTVRVTDSTSNTYDKTLTITVTDLNENPKVAIASDISGNYVVVREAELSKTGGWDIVAQRYNADGTLNGAETTINTTTANDQFDPAVAMDANGNFVVVWSTQGQGEAASDSNIIYRVYDNSGTAITGELVANTYTSGDQQFASVAYDGNGAFIITWSSQGQDDAGNATGWGVYAQRFNADGTKNGSEFLVNTTTAGDQKFSDVSADDVGDFVIAWQSFGQDGDGWGIYAKTWRDSGALLHDEVLRNTYTTGDQHSVTVAMEADGDYSLAWVSDGQDGDQGGIYGDNVAWGGSGTNNAGEFQISSTTAGNQSSPEMAADPTGNLVISWTSTGQDGDSTAQSNLYGQLYWMKNSGPLAQGSEFLINSYTTATQGSPSVTADPAGDVIVAWSGQTATDPDGNDQRIFTTALSNQTPIISLGSTAITYTEDNAPLAIDSSLTVSDPDSANLAGATISIRDAFVAGEDLLGFTDQLSISGSYDAATGILTLTGAASIADYQTALRSVTYSNSSNTPDTTQRVIEFTVDDGTASSSDTRKLNITATNDAPIIDNLTPSIAEGNSTLTITATDPEGDALGSFSISGGTDASLFSLDSATGVLTFNTAPDFENPTDNNADNTYEVEITTSDNLGASLAQLVKITVTNVNDAPTASNNTVTTNEDTPYTFTASDFGFSDVDSGDNLASIKITALESAGSLQLGGVDVTLNQIISRADIDAGNFSFSPASNANGSGYDSFGFTVNDGSLDSVSTYTLTVDVTPVNDAPTTTGLANISVLENTPGTTVDLPSAFADVEQASSTLTYTASSSDGNLVTIGGISGGTLSLAFVANQTGSATITVRAADSTGAFVESSFNVAVTPAGQITQLVPLSASSAEDSSLVFSSANGNSLTISDGSTGDNYLRTTLSVDSGTLSLASTAGITLDAGANGSSSLTISGLKSDINAALNGLVYQPTANYNGNATLTLSTDIAIAQAVQYSFEDSTNPGLDSSPNALNNAIASGTAPTVDSTRGNVLSFNGSSDFLEVPDQLGQPANVSYSVWVDMRSGASEQVVLSLNGLGLRLDDSGSTSGAGIKGFFHDGNTWQEVSVGTNLVNTGWHHIALTFDDVNNRQTLYLDGVAVATTNATQSIDYSQGTSFTVGRHGDIPIMFFSGQMDDVQVYSRALTANDVALLYGGSDKASDTVPLSITAVNDEQVLDTNAALSLAEGSEATLSSTQLSASDIDNSTSELIYTVTTTPLNGSLLLNGVATTTFTQADIDSGLVSYRHDGSETSSDSFAFSLDDGSGAATSGSFTINITPVNDAPVFSSPAQANMAENSLLAASLSAMDADSPADTLTFSIVGGSDASLFTLDAASGELSFVTTPDFEQPTDANGDGRYEITVGVSDGQGGQAQLDLSILVTDINESPSVSNATTALTYTEDTPLHLDDIRVADVDGDQLSLTLTLSDPGAGTLSSSALAASAVTSSNGIWRATGSAEQINALLAELMFIPTADFHDTVTLEVRVSDGITTLLAGEKTIIGIPVADSPEVGSVATLRDALTAPIPISPNPVDGAEVTYFQISDIRNGSLFLANGTTPVRNGDFITLAEAAAGVRFLPDPTATGDGSFAVQASLDGQSIAPNSQPSTARVVISAPIASETPPAEAEPAPQPEPGPEPTTPTIDPVSPSEEEQSTLIPLPPKEENSAADLAEDAQETILPRIEKEPAPALTLSAEQRQHLQITTFSQHQKVLSTAELLNMFLEQVQLSSQQITASSYQHLYDSLEQLRSEQSLFQLGETHLIGSAVTVSSGLTVGYVVWMIRGGMLASSVMVSLPAWQIADPLPILAGGKNADEDEESLESIIEGDGKKPKKPPAGADDKAMEPEA